MHRKRVRKILMLLFMPMIVAVLLTRLFLFLMPGAGSGFAGIHVNHLLIGVLLMTVGGIPALLTEPHIRTRGPAIGLFGLAWAPPWTNGSCLVMRESSPEEPTRA